MDSDGRPKFFKGSAKVTDSVTYLNVDTIKIFSPDDHICIVTLHEYNEFSLQMDSGIQF